MPDQNRYRRNFHGRRGGQLAAWRFPLIAWASGLAILAMAILLLRGADAAMAAFEEPVPIAERTIDLERTPRDGVTSEFIDVPGPDKRYGSIVLSTVTGSVFVKGLRLTGEDGQTRDILVDRLLLAAAPPVEVPLAETDVGVTRLEVLYRRPPAEAGAGVGNRSARLLVAGRRLEATPPRPQQGPAPSAAAPAARPPPASGVPTAADQTTAARLVKIAGRSFDLARAEIVLEVGPDIGAVGTLQIRTRDMPVIVRQIVLTFASGATREIKIGQLIEAGGASRSIDVGGPGDAPRQEIRTIVIEVRPRTADDTGVIEVWGDPSGDDRVVRAPPSAIPRLPERDTRAPRAKPRIADADTDTELVEPGTDMAPGDVPPPPRRQIEGQRPDERNWRLLGSTVDEAGAGPRARRAVFIIRRVAGEITALRFLPRRDVVRLANARAYFADGREQRLDVRGFELEPGQMTDVLTIRGGDVVRVEVVYRAMDAFAGPAVLELWARVEPDMSRPSRRRDVDDGYGGESSSGSLRRRYRDDGRSRYDAPPPLLVVPGG